MLGIFLEDVALAVLLFFEKLGLGDYLWGEDCG